MTTPGKQPRLSGWMVIDNGRPKTPRDRQHLFDSKNRQWRWPTAEEAATLDKCEKCLEQEQLGH